MNSKEQAEKIKAILMDCVEGQLNEAVDRIMVLVSEAEREVMQHTIATSFAIDKASYEKGFRAAQEKEAEIAEFKSGMTDTRHETADRIRKMEIE